MRRVVTIAAVAAFVAPGCGGSDGGGETGTETVTGAEGAPLSKSEYIAKADAICKRQREANKEPIRELADALESGDAEKAADLLEEALQESQSAFDEIRALEPPPEDQEVIDEYFELREGERAFGARAVDALRDEDIRKVKFLIDETDSTDQRANGLAQSYGFKECGQGD